MYTKLQTHWKIWIGAVRHTTYFQLFFLKVVYKETEKYMSVIHVFIRFTSGDEQHSESEPNDGRKQRYILLATLAKGYWRTVKGKAVLCITP
jgi:hypothetical protein